ncbi:MAG: DUF2236 domain-containing protein [Thermoleophilaceae bacterium]|nr:DUF2236 domain-containing protein [Thermoleophilaceae bacterium]
MNSAESTSLPLGKETIAYRVASHPVTLIGAARAASMQALHPLVIAGVSTYSSFRSRPLERLRRTGWYVNATAFGHPDTAAAAAAHVTRMHARVNGVDPVTGERYDANDPEQQLYVHLTEWHSFLVAYRTYVRAVSESEADRMWSEVAPLGALLGTPIEMIPTTAAAVREYFATVNAGLRASPAALETIRFLLSPPPIRELAPFRPAFPVAARAAIATFPHHARALAGLGDSPGLDALTVAAVRPAVALTMPLLRRAQRMIAGPQVYAFLENAPERSGGYVAPVELDMVSGLRAAA